MTTTPETASPNGPSWRRTLGARTLADAGRWRLLFALFLRHSVTRLYISWCSSPNRFVLTLPTAWSSRDGSANGLWCSTALGIHPTSGCPPAISDPSWPSSKKHTKSAKRPASKKVKGNLHNGKKKKRSKYIYANWNQPIIYPNSVENLRNSFFVTSPMLRFSTWFWLAPDISREACHLLLLFHFGSFLC